MFLMFSNSISARKIEDVAYCIPKNFTCEHDSCIAIEFIIYTGSGSYDFFVGDYFWYNITLKNIGNTTANLNLTVKVYNNLREVIGTVVTYFKNIEPNEITYLFPNITSDEEKYYIFEFDTIGSYKIEITSENYFKIIEFYHYQDDCKSIFYDNRYPFYFDAMPKWERTWKEEMRSQIIISQEILKNISEYSEKISDFSREMVKSSNKMEILTWVIIILTIINVCFVWYTIKKSISQFVSQFVYMFFVLLILSIFLYSFFSFVFF